MTETRIDLFTINLPNPAFLYANGRQQLLVNIEIVLQYRHNNGIWLPRQLSQAEVQSLTLVNPNAPGATRPPENWWAVSVRYEYQQGNVGQFFSGEMEDSEGALTKREQRQVENDNLSGQRTFERFLMTTAVQHMNFTAGIQIDGLGWVTASGINNTQRFSFQSTPELRIRSAQLQRRVNELLHDHNKGQWRGLHEVYWTIPNHIPILRETIEGQNNGSHLRQTVNFREQFAGVLRTHESRTVVLTTNQMTAPFPGRSPPREPNRQFRFNSIGLIRTYFFYDSYVTGPGGHRNNVVVTLIDRAGNRSQFIVSGQGQAYIRDA